MADNFIITKKEKETKNGKTITIDAFCGGERPLVR